MATINSTVGLVSGLNIKDIVSALIKNDQSAISRVDDRRKQFAAIQAGFTALSANLLGISTPLNQLSQTANFDRFSASSSETTQLTVTAQTGATGGSYQAQVLRLSSSQQSISRGFVDTDVQTVGAAGQVVIQTGGRLSSPTRLEALNGGSGVQRGTFRITDKAGVSRDIDIRSALNVDEVLAAVNSADGLGVRAEARGDKLVLIDTTGSGSGSITVTERNGGRSAADLGLLGTTAGGELQGSSVYNVTGNFRLDRINDGLSLRLTEGQPDLKITLSDAAATVLDIDINGSVTLNDVVKKINGATGNAGKVSASVTNGRLVLTDTTGGGGPNAFSVANIGGTNVTNVLGLTDAPVGNTLTGDRLGAGINSVLLRNLRGGSGISVPGQVTLTDRAGTTATVDLSAAESLDQVLTAINSATDGLGNRVKIEARINSRGTGLEIVDSSGGTGNLVVQDVGAGTVATDLGIAISAAQSQKTGTSLSQRYVGETASLSTYRNGDAVRRGSIVVVDSTGTEFSVAIPETARTLGDVIDRVNAASSGKVTAQLNRTGDGFELVDNAGGSGQLQVKELAGGTTAADLKLLGTGITGDNGKSYINSRQATIVDIAATDTLSQIVSKLNSARGPVGASILSDGSDFAPNRLLLSATKTGSAGNVIIDDGGLGLDLTTRATGQDALLRVGSGTDGNGSFLLSSSTNRFVSALPGLDIDAKGVGTTAAQVTVTRDTGRVVDLARNFVNAYNDFVTKTAEQTKFKADTTERGVLQGSATALRVTSTLATSLTETRYGSSGGAFRSLSSLGITVDASGKLSLDSFKLQASLATNPDAVRDFFLNKDTGFAVKLQKTIESFTDPLSGKITAETNTLKGSVDSSQKRIDQLTVLLTSRQQRLFNQFYNMELALSKLNSQQTALGKITSVSSSSS
jgi:flagellar hook-associated protein 2